MSGDFCLVGLRHNQERGKHIIIFFVQFKLLHDVIVRIAWLWLVHGWSFLRDDRLAFGVCSRFRRERRN